MALVIAFKTNLIPLADGPVVTTAEVEGSMSFKVVTVVLTRSFDS